MKKFPFLLLLAFAAASLLSACNDDEGKTVWSAYRAYREANNDWLLEQQRRTNPDGSPYFSTVVPAWDPSAFVLIHYFNDTTLTRQNLSPLYTSTIDTRYIGRYYNGEAFDSSTLATKYGPGIFRTDLRDVIKGWTIAFERMHVGDTAEIIIPWQQAYGESTSSAIPPYSNLQFNVRLVDIHAYEQP